jgi:acyl-CoA-binding protein
MYENMIEFVFIDGPFDCPDSVPGLTKFLPEGETKFKAWLQFHSWATEDAQKGYHTPDR